MRKTVFISSTSEDLHQHRAKAWEKLTEYDVNIKGMERFGASKDKPIETCLRQVEQSDIFICIIAYKLGTVEISSSKSFVELEYEKALALDKEILVYMIDDRNAKVSPMLIDFGENRIRLEEFKSVLQDRHTVDTFIDELDLADKLGRKFDELLSKKNKITKHNEYVNSEDILKKFFLLPKLYSGKEIKLRVKFEGEPFAASRKICDNFYFSYGSTIGIRIKTLLPGVNNIINYIYIESFNIDDFIHLDRNEPVEIYASTKFTTDNIEEVKANFVSQHYVKFKEGFTSRFMPFREDDSFYDTEVIKGEGHMILHLKKIIFNNNKSNPQKANEKSKNDKLA